jgi:hypothetical protein
MSGRLTLVPEGEPVRKHDHIDVRFEGARSLRLTDPRRFGAMLWLAGATPEKHALLRDLGLEPLEREFTGKALQEKARGRKVAVKLFLMNSHVVTGVGNIYANEALFRARRPSPPAGGSNLARALGSHRGSGAHDIAARRREGRHDIARLRLGRRRARLFPRRVPRVRARGQALHSLRHADQGDPPGPALDFLLPALPAMSATGTWVVPQRAFETSLNDLRDWRQSLAAELTAFRRWAIVSRLIDDHATARLAHIERRLAAERLTVAFIAEFSRGKSELINALFFSDMGIRLLPSGVGRTTLCPAEILWDAARPPSIRLLPIESRANPESLRELLAANEGWREIALDPKNLESLPPPSTCSRRPSSYPPMMRRTSASRPTSRIASKSRAGATPS